MVNDEYVPTIVLEKPPRELSEVLMIVPPGVHLAVKRRPGEGTLCLVWQWNPDHAILQDRRRRPESHLKARPLEYIEPEIIFLTEHPPNGRFVVWVQPPMDSAAADIVLYWLYDDESREPDVRNLCCQNIRAAFVAQAHLSAVIQEQKRS
jgi:hypothetical protein